jgi:hypothetical protein
MKTLREILWQRHRSVEPQLDDIRQKTLANLTLARSPFPEPASEMERLTPTLSSAEEEREKGAVQSVAREGRGIREMILSFRWHVAGMSAAWVLVALLNIDPSPSPVADMAQERIPSPQQLFAAFRENRRQIAELLEAPGMVSEPSTEPPLFIPQRRGGIQSTNSIDYYG